MSADVPVHALAVYHDEDIVVVQSVELDMAAHVAVMEGEGRAEPLKGRLCCAPDIAPALFREHLCFLQGRLSGSVQFPYLLPLLR